MDTNKTSTLTMLSALAQETRLDLFRLLVKQGPDGLNAGDIATKLNVPRSTLSYHLTELEQAKLIQSQKISRQIIYRANYDKLGAFISFLVEDCCQGSGEFCFNLKA